MNQYLNILKKTKIFEGLSEYEIMSALNCLKATIKTFEQQSTVFSEGDRATFIGILLSGEIQTQKTGYDGSVNIISKLFACDMVAGVASFSKSKLLPFDVVAVSNVTLLCLSNKSLVSVCCKACQFHTKLIENMLCAIADKNLQLSHKIDILTRRTIREKVLSYLYSQSKKSKGKIFSIDLTRRQMADFLSVDRSALSRELSNMQSEGLLEFHENHFKLN